MPGNIQPLRWLFLTLAVSMFITSPAYSWGSRGHDLVAALAETQLTDTARKRIKELLPQGTTLALRLYFLGRGSELHPLQVVFTTFLLGSAPLRGAVCASTWPDKAGRQIPDMDAYHFINFLKDANAYDQRRDCKLRNCVIEAISWYLQVIKSPDAPRLSWWRRRILISRCPSRL